MFIKKSAIITFCLAATIFSAVLPSFGCADNGFGEAFAGQQRGFVEGRVTDESGSPLSGVKIIVDHSIFYNSNITTVTDSSGNYKLKVPTGSWYAFAQYKKTYNGKTYTFYLEPDSYAGFGGEGATRNFVWKLTGKKEEPLAAGFFGGTITFDNFPTGNYIEDENDIEFVLKPTGVLIDGSEGKTLRLRSKDGFHLEDIPIGRYEISASYRGKTLGLRRWNTDGKFEKSLQVDFEPQIAGQCDNCAKLEYYF